VLLNLVGNAIKFTDSGEVRIAAGAANGHFTVSVSDTGPGIPAEEREQIFEKFRQVDSSNTRAMGGTGLGLAIAREIVEMHGGRIWVESRLGQGSTFRMELPVRSPTSWRVSPGVCCITVATSRSGKYLNQRPNPRKEPNCAGVPSCSMLSRPSLWS